MKKIFSFVIISSLIISSCGSSTTPVETIKKDSKSVKTLSIKKDYFREQIKLVGKVAPLLETPVSAQVGGIIKTVKADVGSKVKKGTILASIDLGSSTYGTSFNNANTAYNNSLTAFGFTEESIKNDLESAKVQLENAKTSKANTYTTTEKQLELAQTQLDNIRKNQVNTELTTGESLKNSELMLENSKTNLENLKKNSEESLNSIYENLKVTLSSAIINLNSSITQADIILGVSEMNKNANNSYETYLGAKDSSSKLAAENTLREIITSFIKDQNIANSSRVELDTKTSEILAQVTKSVGLYDKITLTLNNSITSSSFTQAQLDGLSAIVAKYQGTLLQSQSQITALKNTIATTNSSIETNTISLQNAINIAQAQLNNIKAGNNSQLDNINGNETLTQAQLENANATVKQARDSVDNAVKIAQASYDSINAKLNSQRVQTKSAVDQAKGGKDLAGIQLNNTSIIAPFDGIITAKNIEVGSMVNPGTPTFMLSDNDQLKIKLDVNSDNITYLKLGQEVEVSKTTETFTGIISLISPASDPVTKMFKAEISFAKKPSNLNLGDFVDVYINKEKGTDKIIMVPYSSVISLGQGDYNVYVIKNSKAISRSVKIGEQNSNDIQVISGLVEGDKVVISGALNLQDGDLVNEQKD